MITCACVCRSTKKGEFFVRYGIECLECIEYCFKELEAKEAEFKCIKIKEAYEVEEP
jgi:hypothetical protein